MVEKWMTRIVGAAPRLAVAPLALATTLAMGCGDGAGGGASLPCNGSTDLCSKGLDEISLVRTNNSHASADDGYNVLARTQLGDVPRQLADGVRGLSLDVYDVGGIATLYHGVRLLGSQPFAPVLEEIRTFLDANPREVLVIGIQNETSVAQVVDSIEASGLDAYAHVQEPGAPWPSLRAMIEADRRVVWISDEAAGGPPWFHAESELVYGSPCCPVFIADLTCETETPPFEGGLYFLRHHLTRPIALESLAASINYDPLLSDRLERCTQEVALPNLVNVDYYDIGDVFRAVDTLNQATGAS